MESIFRKTLLYQSGVEYADFCLNHVEGCAHGCRFPCYAYLLKKRCGVIKNYNDWIKPKLVANALDLLDSEIPKYKSKIKYVHLCFSTDPFMYNYPEVAKMTLRIIGKLNRANIRCIVLTKGIFPKDLIRTEKYGANNEYGISLVSLDEQFKQKFEPFSAPYADRISSLKFLHEHGLKTWVSIEPYPTPAIIKQDLRQLLKAIAFVDKIIFGKWNYNRALVQISRNDNFYSSCVDTIMKFCKNLEIDFHIKNGTIEKYNTKTENIFAA